MKKITDQLFKVHPVDLLVFEFDRHCKPTFRLPFSEDHLRIEKKELDLNRSEYSVYLDEEYCHRSRVFKKVNALTMLNAIGPGIGDCATPEKFKGKSLYPYTIHYISQLLLQQGIEKVFILVAPDNAASIRGIEKAGFRPVAHIQARRWLKFYFGKRIKNLMSS